MSNTNDKTTGAPRSLDGLVGCPICGEPRSEFQRGKTMTVHGDYVGVEACDWCGSTFFTSTLDGEMEPSPKAPNSGISGKLSTYDRIKVSNKEKAKQ